jgi:uncharacterized repeat protein (TIGR01451 family)
MSRISLRNTRIAFAAFALMTGLVHAAEQGCIELKNTVEVEQEYVNEQGQKAQRLVPAAKVVPGDEVVYTITAKNVCDQPVDDIVIANPIPEHMTYVANSAIGPGTDIEYSLDAQTYAPAEQLTVTEADGNTRPARADEYRAIRWTFKNSFAPGATAFVRYRALLN